MIYGDTLMSHTCYNCRLLVFDLTQVEYVYLEGALSIVYLECLGLFFITRCALISRR